jgi:hypothetical protein
VGPGNIQPPTPVPPDDSIGAQNDNDDNDNDDGDDNDNNGNYNDNDDNENYNDNNGNYNDNDDSGNYNDNSVIVVEIEPDPHCSTPGTAHTDLSEDERMSLTIPAESYTSLRVAMRQVKDETLPPGAKAAAPPRVYQFDLATCDGFAVAKLPQQAWLRARYDPAEYPDVDEKSLRLALFEHVSDVWIAVPSQLNDPPGNFVVGQIDHPGLYAVLPAKALSDRTRFVEQR